VRVDIEARVLETTNTDVFDEGARLAANEVASLRDENACLRDELAKSKDSLAHLRVRYRQLLEELFLLKRRLFVAKAERVDDVVDAQLAFDVLLAETQPAEKVQGATSTDSGQQEPSPPPENKPQDRTRKPPKGRRDLSKCDLPEVRVEVPDPELEGKLERIGVDESSHVAFERGGYRRLVIVRIVYKEAMKQDECRAPERGSAAAAAAQPTFRIVTAPMPKEIMPRGILAPSMIAHVLAMKYVLGVPFHRYEQQCAREGFPLDRGTMCRYAEHVGATLGCIVEAARKEAIATAFCLSTDATGVAIQPTRLEGAQRQPCRKGHFFVTLADKDHVFLDFQPKHTSLTVWQMFKGFSGYVQADAHVIYDALFKGIPPEGADEKPGECGPPPIEVGCFSHARRKYWEAAVCKHPLGLEGVQLIDAIFDADRPLGKLPPVQRKVRRDHTVRPLVDAFFTWARAEYDKLTERGLVATALGYSVRQEQALRRFLDDGRLRMDNNSAERELRSVAVGRRAWMFYGSDDHASAAGNILSLVASCKLHDLDPEPYLSEVIHVVPYWPRDRYLELAPRYWRATRARLSVKELASDLGLITVPPPLPKEQPSSN
jgi:transposase